MTTLHDLVIQRDCARDCSTRSVGSGMRSRERALETMYFRNQDAERIAALKAKKRSNKCKCQPCTCENCTC